MCRFPITAPGVGATLMAIVLASHFVRDGHNDQRLLELLALTLAAIWICLRPAAVLLPATRLGKAVLAGFFSIGLLSASLAYSPVHGYWEVGMLLLLLLVAFAVAGNMQRNFHAALALVLKLALAGCALYLFQLAVAYTMVLSTRVVPDFHQFFGGFSNYRFFNHGQTIMLPLLVLWCCLPGLGRAGRLMSIGITASWWMLLVATAGRGTMLGLAAGVLTVLLVQRRNALSLLAYFFGTALLGYALHWLFFLAVPPLLGMEPFTLATSIVERTVADPTSLRIPLWERAWALFTADPLLGAGPHHFAHFRVDPENASHPHNWVFQIAAEWGLPALICMIGAIGLGMLHLLKTAAKVDPLDRANLLAGGALVIVGVAILIDGLVSGLLVMPVSQALIALYTGCAFAWVRCMNGTPPAAMTPRIALVMRGAAAVSLLAVWLAAAPGLIESQANKHRRGIIEDTPVLWMPRLWMDGRF